VHSVLDQPSRQSVHLTNPDRVSSSSFHRAKTPRYRTQVALGSGALLLWLVLPLSLPRKLHCQTMNYGTNTMNYLTRWSHLVVQPERLAQSVVNHPRSSRLFSTKSPRVYRSSLGHQIRNDPCLPCTCVAPVCLQLCTLTNHQHPLWLCPTSSMTTAIANSALSILLPAG
jgi:hypothetical protein